MKKKIFFFIPAIIAVVIVSCIYFFSCTKERSDVWYAEGVHFTEEQKKAIEEKQKAFQEDYKMSVLKVAPIKFYGIVIDQNNVPVSGATVILDISNPQEDGKRELITDANGQFEISGLKGSVLRIISIKNKGYIYDDSGYRSYDFVDEKTDIYIPDKNNPEIFRMWEKGESEPLIKNEINKGIIPDGKPYYIDLARGRGSISSDKINNIDLIVELMADDQVVQKKFNWNIVLRATDRGGIVETEDLFLYKAPEDGYQNFIELSFDKKDKSWGKVIKRKFYLKSRGGELYSGFNCMILLYNNKKGRVIIESVINPNGSTNLEYDPSKRILDP
jgi:hypothetical protein